MNEKCHPPAYQQLCDLEGGRTAVFLGGWSARLFSEITRGALGLGEIAWEGGGIGGFFFLLVLGPAPSKTIWALW